MKIFSLVLLFVLLTSAAISQNNNAYALTTSIWLKTTISVCWDNPSTGNKTEREWVREAIKDTWEKNSRLVFTDWCEASQKPDADIHILIADDTPHTDGLGRELQGKAAGMVLNFTFDNFSVSCKGRDREFCIKAIAAHEFGHAIGFAHEQNRPDCKFPNCFGERARPQGENGDWAISACDIYSIMNYCNPNWNN